MTSRGPSWPRPFYDSYAACLAMGHEIPIMSRALKCPQVECCAAPTAIPILYWETPLRRHTALTSHRALRAFPREEITLPTLQQCLLSHALMHLTPSKVQALPLCSTSSAC